MGQDTVSPMTLDFRGRPVSRPIGKDFDESARLAKLPEVKPQACHSNCFAVIHDLPGYHQASYVEGFAVAYDGFPFDHAWLVKDGLIVDPTLPVGITRYVAGLEFVGVSGIEAFLRDVKKEVRHLRDALGSGGFASPSYCRAYLDAYAEMSGFEPPRPLLTVLEHCLLEPGEFSTAVPATANWN